MKCAGYSKQTYRLFHSINGTRKLPFTIEEFKKVYNNPIVKTILFGEKGERNFLYPGLQADSPLEEIAHAAAVHINKAELSWSLLQHQQYKLASYKLGNIAHTVSDRKLTRILSAILKKPGIKHESLLFEHSPYLSACITGEEQTYFRVNPSTLQAKLIIELDPHQIFFTAPRDIGSATAKYNDNKTLDNFYRCLNDNNISAKILTGLIHCVTSTTHPIELRAQINEALQIYLADSKVYALDPVKNKNPLEHHYGYTPQYLIAKTPDDTKHHSQKRQYNEILIARHENIKVIKLIIEESDLQAAKNAASMGNIDAQQALENLHEVVKQGLLVVEHIPDTEAPHHLSTKAKPIERLNYAVFKHDKKTIEELLGPLDTLEAKGTLPMTDIGNMGHALQTACYIGDNFIVNKILDSAPELINYAEGMPLLTALYRRDETLVRLLVKRGADPRRCHSEITSILQTSMTTDKDREKYITLLGLTLNDSTSQSQPNGYVEFLPMAMGGRAIYRLDPARLPSWENITEPPPTQVLQFLANHYINIPYEDEWEKRFAVDNIIVYRPNHDVTHAIRQQEYINYFIDRIEKQGKEKYKHLLSDEARSLLNLAAFIGRAGRTNEHRAFADPLNAQRSANIFTAIAKRYGFCPNLISIVANIICNKKETQDTVYRKETDTTLAKMMYVLLHESHALDMTRMLTKDAFEKKLKPPMEHAFKEFFDNNLEKELISDALVVAQNACKAKGNMCLYAGVHTDNLKLKANCVRDISYGMEQTEPQNRQSFVI